MPDSWGSDAILRPGNERRKRRIMAQNERLRKQREKKKDETTFGGFLGSAAKVLTLGNDEVVRVGKRVFKEANEYSEDRLRDLVPDRRKRKPTTLDRTPRKSLDVSPGILGALVRAGGGKILRPGRLDLDELFSRFPAAKDSKGFSPPRTVARQAELRGESTDWAMPGRLPWVMDRKVGSPEVLPPGSTHGSWAGYNRFQDRMMPSEIRDRIPQGWLYNPAEDEADIMLGAQGLSRITDWSAPEQKGLLDLLTTMFGRNSHITDDMIYPYGGRAPGLSSIEERLMQRQGAHRVARLRELLGGQ